MQPFHNLFHGMALSLSDEEFQRRLQSMPSLAEKNAKKHQSACLSKSAAIISATNGRIDSQVINKALLIWTDTKSHRFNHSANHQSSLVAAGSPAASPLRLRRRPTA
jgi:hypothetical protein